MDKKVLITGGAGFIGSNLVEDLLEKDYKITILDNFSSGYRKNLKEFEDKISIINGDIRDKNLLDKLVDETICVFHLAAMVSVPESIENPAECYDINLTGSLNIIEACIKYNSKFIFASSAAVYGEDKTEIKTENIDTIPISPYGLSKLDIEKLCIIYNKESNLEFTCFRNFNVYGPKQDISSSYAAVIPKFITLSLKQNDLTIFGDGSQTRDFIYVKDVTSAYINALENNIIGIYNLGCSDIESVKSLAGNVIYKTNSKSNIKFYESRKGDIKHSRASSEKFQKLSNWKPVVSLDKGIDKTISYYKNENN